MFGFLFGVNSTDEIVCPQIVIGLTGGKHVPDDHAEFMRDGNDGFVLRGRAARTAELADMPTVEALQVARGARGGPPAFDEHVLEMLVAFPGLAGMAFTRGFVVAGAQSDPGREMFG